MTHLFFFSVLRSTQAAFSPNSQTVTKWDHAPKNLLQLIKEIQGLSTSMQERLLGRSCPRTNFLFTNKAFTQFTPAEHSALQVSSQPVLLVNPFSSKLFSRQKWN